MRFTSTDQAIFSLCPVNPNGKEVLLSTSQLPTSMHRSNWLSLFLLEFIFHCIGTIVKFTLNSFQTYTCC
jgi:hypothetical protein